VARADFLKLGEYGASVIGIRHVQARGWTRINIHVWKKRIFAENIEPPTGMECKAWQTEIHQELIHTEYPNLVLGLDLSRY
jgi:hypothetical protein